MTIYKLPLDDVLDKDIIDWIASFPRNRKAEYVRQVLRNHIHNTSVPIGEGVATDTEVKVETAPPIMEETEIILPKKSRFSNATDSLGMTENKASNKLNGLAR